MWINKGIKFVPIEVDFILFDVFTAHCQLVIMINDKDVGIPAVEYIRLGIICYTWSDAIDLIALLVAASSVRFFNLFSYTHIGHHIKLL